MSDQAPFQAGQIIGDFEIFSGEVRKSSLVARTSCELMHLREGALRSLFHERRRDSVLKDLAVHARAVGWLQTSGVAEVR